MNAEFIFIVNFNMQKYYQLQ